MSVEALGTLEEQQDNLNIPSNDIPTEASPSAADELASATEDRSSTLLRKAAKKLLAMTLAVAASTGATAGGDIALAGASYASTTNTRADSSGTVEAYGANWLDGQGVNVYSNGDNAKNDTGVSCVTVKDAPGGSGCASGSVYAGEKWQCVELVNRLYLSRGWISNTWWGDGDQIYDKAPSSLVEQPNGSITSIAPGDVISLGDYTTGKKNDDGGHAAIIEKVSDNTATIMNQNTPDITSYATLANGYLNMSGWSGYNVIGVIDAPGSVQSPAAPNTVTRGSLSSSGPISDVLETSGRRDIFTGSSSGDLYWSHWQPGDTAWTTGEIASPAEDITAVTSVYWNSGKLSVYYGTSNGDLYESWYEPGGGWTTSLLGNLGGGVNALSGQVVDSNTNAEVDIFAGTANGSIYEAWWKSGSPWTISQIDTVSAADDSIQLVRPNGTSELDVFRGTASGEIHEDYWTGPGDVWHGAQIANFGSKVNGLEGMMYGSTYNIYAALSSGNVDEAWFTPGDSSWSTGQAGSYSSALTGISGMQIGNQVELLPTLSSGTLNERYWSPGSSWAGGQVANLGSAAIGITSMLQPSASERDVYTVDSSGNIKESWWASGQSSWQTSQIGTAN